MGKMLAESLILPIAPDQFRGWSDQLVQDLDLESYAPIWREMGYPAAKRGGVEDKSTAPGFSALLKNGVKQKRVLERMRDAEQNLRARGRSPAPALEVANVAPTPEASELGLKLVQLQIDMEGMSQRIAHLGKITLDLQEALEIERDANKGLMRRLEQAESRIQGALLGALAKDRPEHPLTKNKISPALKREKEPWRHLPNPIVDLVKLAVQEFQSGAQEAEARAAGVSSFLTPRWLAWRWLSETERRRQHPVHPRYEAEGQEALQDFESWRQSWTPPEPKAAPAPRPAAREENAHEDQEDRV